jgi:CrcB protein
MWTWAMVLLGGALGSGLRYGVALALPPRGEAAFPVATLTVNLVGCLLIGLLATLLHESAQLPPAARMGLIVGVLGGFTTFSSFGLESLRLLQAGHWGAAALYIGLSNIAGLLAVWIGTKGAGG